MAFCVNCGVKLEQSIKTCPLCNTPVYHPAQIPDPAVPPPFPEKKGEIGRVKRTDQAILISVIVICTAIGCGLLNLFVFTNSFWSFYVIGVCAVLWVFCIPAMLYQRLPFAVMVIFDMAAVVMYCAIIAHQFQGLQWFLSIVVPVAITAGILIIIVGTLYRYVSKSILFTAMIIFLAIGIFCTVLDVCISYYLSETLRITWSAVVLTCCFIIAVTLFTIMRISRLREEVRRRMHI